MSKSQANLFFWLGTVLLAVAFVAATQRTASFDAAGAAATLTVISGGAVVIERLLEAFWSLIDATKGQPWPLDVVGTAIDDEVAGFGASVEGSVTKLKGVVDRVQALAPEASDIKKKLDDAKAAYDKDIADLKHFAGLSNQQQLQVRLDAFSKQMNTVLGQYPAVSAALGRDFNVAGDLLGATDQLLKSFDDNPGRRLLSLYAGGMLGIGIAAALGLDVFAATGGTPTDLVHQLAVPTTGLIMGLGSNPTHEVIKALQTLKDRGPQKQPGA